jgi:predicted alpha/beta-hydrolase family hydrolase
LSGPAIEAENYHELGVEHIGRPQGSDKSLGIMVRGGMTRFLFSGPAATVATATATVLLAHGAGAPMDSAAMNAAAEALAEAGLRVARFEFGYMAARRPADGHAGARKPPPRAETLRGEYLAALDAMMKRDIASR